MADVYTVFGTLLALGIAFPGMLAAWWLIFSDVVARAQRRVDQTPRKCLGAGIGIIIPLSIVIGILLAIPLGVFKFIGVIFVVLALGFTSLGTAGIALTMGNRLTANPNDERLSARNFILAAVVLELAAIFPIVGWFLMIPGTILISFGAAYFAIIRRESTRSEISAPQEPALSHG